jgi:hypothetical protein
MPHRKGSEKSGTLTIVLSPKAPETEGVVAIGTHNAAILVSRAPFAASAAQMA